LVRAGRVLSITLFRIAYDARITHRLRRVMGKIRLSQIASPSRILVRAILSNNGFPEN